MLYFESSSEASYFVTLNNELAIATVCHLAFDFNNVLVCKLSLYDQQQHSATHPSHMIYGKSSDPCWSADVCVYKPFSTQEQKLQILEHSTHGGAQNKLGKQSSKINHLQSSHPWQSL